MSRADFELDRALMRSEFTPQERARVRSALGIDPKQDVDIPGPATPEENREEQHHGPLPGRGERAHQPRP